MHARCHECDRSFNLPKADPRLVCPFCGNTERVRRNFVPPPVGRCGESSFYGRSFAKRLAEGFELIESSYDPPDSDDDDEFYFDEHEEEDEEAESWS